MNVSDKTNMKYYITHNKINILLWICTTGGKGLLFNQNRKLGLQLKVTHSTVKIKSVKLHS